MNATGVAATVPTRELNLSNEFPKAMQASTDKAITTVLYKLISQVLREPFFRFR
jgi:hypothetical protein